MKTYRTLFIGLAIILSFVQFSTAQTNYSWTGGTSSNWNEATNWSPAGVPGMIDTALITMEGDYTVNLDVDTTVAKIVLGGPSGTQTFSLSNRTLTVNGVFEIDTNGVLSLASSTITGTGSILNSGILKSSQGTFNMGFVNYGQSTFTGTNELTDTIITHPNSVLDIVSSGAINFRSEKGFENNGLMQCKIGNYWGGGQVEVTNGSLVNNADGELKILVTGTLSSSSTAFKLILQLENNGNVLVGQHTYLEKNDAKHVNNGELSLQNHVLIVNQGGTSPSFKNTGNIVVDDKSTLRINGGTYEYISGLLDVQGVLEINNATANIIPDYTNSILLSFSQSTINCSASFTNKENLSLNNSIVNGSNFFINQDTLMAAETEFNMDFKNEGLTRFSGITDINDTLITLPNTVLQIVSSGNPMQFTSARGFTNYGLIESLTYNYWAGGFITITEGTLVNDEQGSIEISVPGTISSASTALKLHFTLENNGDISIDHNTILDNPSAIHTNNGTFRVNSHSFSINQTGTTPAFNTQGEFVIADHAKFAINGGDFNYNSGTFNPLGSSTVANATFNIIPEYNSTGSLTLNTTILNCSEPFTNQSDLTLTNTTINGDYFFTNQDTMTANGIEFNMDFNNIGLASLTGSIVINDTIITHPNSTLNIIASSYMSFTAEKGFTNNGLLQSITANYWGGGAMTVVNGSLTNNESGIFNILVQGALSSASSPLTLAFHLINRGELLIDHKSILSKESVIHENSGVLILNNHPLTINNASTSFVNQLNGSLSGNGTIYFNGDSFTNSGTINPGLSPGLITISGDVSQDSGSVLNIELGGNTVGTLYDKLNVNGALQIDGQLNIELIDGFNPAVGDIFDITGFSSATGDYNEINGLYPGTGVIFNVEQTPTNINLTTVAHTNNPPVIESSVGDLELNEDFDLIQVVKLDTIFSDPDIPLGDKLVFTYELLHDIVTISFVDNVLNLNSVPDSSGISTVVLIASDAGNEMARDTFNIQVTAINDAPVVESPVGDLELDEDFELTDIVNLDTVFTDPDLNYGDHLTYTYELLENIVTVSLIDNVLSLNSIPDINGSGTIVLTASDAENAVARDTFNIQVSAINDAPVVESPVGDLELIEDFELTEVVNLDTVFSDPDLNYGDHLTYTYELLADIVTASINENVLSLASIPDLNGSGAIILIASDTENAVARDTFNIQVSAVNDAPEAFSLISPADGISITESDELIFIWESAKDIDGDEIEYTLNLSTTNWDSIITEITDTVFTFSNISSLTEDETYQWSVSASDGQLVASCLKDFSFTTPASTYSYPNLANSIAQIQNYPNPFISYTSIDFTLNRAENLTIKIYNLQGGYIKTLIDGELPAGRYTYRLDLGELASGTYFYKVSVGSETLVKKMTKIH